jgi:hypothetical protein
MNLENQPTSPIRATKDKTVFEPDYETKQKWLSTRKIPHHANSVHLPGFYQDKTSSVDGILFWSAFMIELLVSFFILFGGLQKRDFIMKVFAVSDVILLISLDLIGAFLVHKMKGKYCFLDNKILVDKSNSHAISLQRKKGKGYAIVGVIVIIISAILKAVGVLLFTKIRMTVFVILLIVYAFIVYVHIEHTGYYWAGKWFRKRFNKQRDEFALAKEQNHHSDFEAEIREHKILTNVNLEIDLQNPITVNNHKLLFLKESPEKYDYKLITTGVMEDAEIFIFVGGKTPEQQKVISEELLKHQVLFIHQRSAEIGAGQKK